MGAPSEFIVFRDIMAKGDDGEEVLKTEPQPHQRNLRAWREQLTSIRTATEFNLHGRDAGGNGVEELEGGEGLQHATGFLLPRNLQK